MSHKFNAIVDKYGGLGKRVVGNMNFFGHRTETHKTGKISVDTKQSNFFSGFMNKSGPGHKLNSFNTLL